MYKRQAKFRDSPIYVDAAEQGLGVMDMIEIRAARKEAAAWKNLVKWVTTKLYTKHSSDIKVARRPLAASKKNITAEHNNSAEV